MSEYSIYISKKKIKKKKNKYIYRKQNYLDTWVIMLD